MPEIKKEREDKHSKFLRVATRRTNAALNAMRSLQSCANRNNYNYNEDEVRQMVDALEGAMNELRDAFAVKLSEKPKDFAFAETTDITPAEPTHWAQESRTLGTGLDIKVSI